MPKVVPSQVVSVLKQAFPSLSEFRTDSNVRITYAAILRAVLQLIDEIPAELITLDAEQYPEFVAAISTVRLAIERWVTGTDVPLTGVQGYQGHALAILIKCLQACPDEAPVAGTSSLEFIHDQEWRTILRTDLSAAESAVRNGEWKAATVLAGSVIEALLLFSLEKLDEGQVRTAAKKLKLKGADSPLNEWHLSDYVKVAKQLEILDDETARQVSLANEFRNLIHPGRAQRLKRACTKGTAYGALAGVERVSEALTLRLRQ